MTVSRSFLISQAVLNAAKHTMPWTLKKDGVACVLAFMLKQPRQLLKETVLIEYRRLVTKYGHPIANDDSEEAAIAEASAGALK